MLAIIQFYTLQILPLMLNHCLYLIQSEDLECTNLTLVSSIFCDIALLARICMTMGTKHCFEWTELFS